MPEEFTRPLRILWARYENGDIRYAVDIPNVSQRRRRWAWQARLDRRSLSAVAQVEHGVYDPEPYHGGFI